MISSQEIDWIVRCAGTQSRSNFKLHGSSSAGDGSVGRCPEVVDRRRDTDLAVAVGDPKPCASTPTDPASARRLESQRGWWSTDAGRGQPLGPPTATAQQKDRVAVSALAS
jgi:hypothetical protein